MLLDAQIKSFPLIMVTEVSLPCSQEPAMVD